MPEYREATPTEQVLLARIDVLDELLAHYRTGKQPSEAMHRRLDATREAERLVREDIAAGDLGECPSHPGQRGDH